MPSKMIATAAGVMALAAPASAAGFTARVTNPYFPLQPGMEWHYRGSEDGEATRETVRVLDGVEKVNGVPCAIIRDDVSKGGRVEESTIDWYTQDSKGNVWYYGEATKELDSRGHVTSRKGSWRAGVAGGKPGIFMPAHPRVGQSFQQEKAKEAQDRFRIVSLRSSITVPFAAYRGNALQTLETTPLEPRARDGKWYARGVGLVYEKALRGTPETNKLVSFKRG